MPHLPVFKISSVIFFNIFCFIAFALTSFATAQQHVLDPQRAVTTTEHILSRAIFAGLVTRDAAGQIGPGLAKSWVVDEGGLRYRFQLQPGLQWRDGNPVDAITIVDSFKRALDPATSAPFYQLLLPIKNAQAFRAGTLPVDAVLGVTSPDPETVIVELSVPSPFFLDALAEPVAMLVGPAQRIADAEGAFMPQPSPTGSRFLYQFLINVTRAPLTQRDVRHALGMVIDRTAIIQSLELPKSEEAYGFRDAPTAAQAPYARISPPDRKAVAEALLLDLKRDATVPLRIVVPNQTMHVIVAEAVATTWRDLGFHVIVEHLPVETYEIALLEGRFDFAWAPVRSFPRPPEQVMAQTLFMFSQAAGPWNMGHYHEPIFDQFLANANADITPEHRASQLRSAENVLIEDQAAIPLFFYSAKIPTANAVMGAPVDATIIHH